MISWHLPGGASRRTATNAVHTASTHAALTAMLGLVADLAIRQPQRGEQSGQGDALLARLDRGRMRPPALRGVDQRAFLANRRVELIEQVDGAHRLDQHRELVLIELPVVDDGTPEPAAR